MASQSSRWHGKAMQRRDLLKLMAATALAQPLTSFAQKLALEDEAFLDDMQRRGCLYFVEQASPATGQVLDAASAGNTTGALDPRRMASIAATGFGLTALCIADKRAYRPHDELLEQVQRTLRFHADQMPHDHGFFYHFTDRETAVAFPGVEISSIDTAILMCGVLTVRAHFSRNAEIVRLATKLYERVDWPWMLNGDKTFSMGVRKGDFLKSRWNQYCELMMLYLLAIGSPSHPVDPACWQAWARPKMTYAGMEYITAIDPLFVHQYSHAWFDFRNKRDAFANYFTNSILATRAHMAFCLSMGKPYSADYWGISASDSRHGYIAWGGPPSFGGIDGSVVPYATAGSLPFLPDACLRVQRALKDRYGKLGWGRYGFCDAMNPDENWYDEKVLGIDLGISVVMAENLRSGFVWSTFAKNKEVGVAMKKAGFRSA
jgi:hypothetical protein